MLFGELGGEIVTGQVAHGKIQHRKQADDIRHVVVADHDKSKRKQICAPFSVIDQTFQPEHHKRKNGERVRPHDIPVIGDEVAAKRVKHAERGD